MSSKILIVTVRSNREATLAEVAQLFAQRWTVRGISAIESRFAQERTVKAFVVFASEEEAMQARNELDGQQTALGSVRLFFSSKSFVHSPHSMQEIERKPLNLPGKASPLSASAEPGPTDALRVSFCPADVAAPLWKLPTPKTSVCPLTLVADGLGHNVSPRVVLNFFSLFGESKVLIIHPKMNYVIAFLRKTIQRSPCFESLNERPFLGAKISIFNVGYSSVDAAQFRSLPDILLIEKRRRAFSKKITQRMMIQNVERSLKAEQVMEVIKVVSPLKRFGLINSTLNDETHAFFAELETQLNAVEVYVVLNGFRLEGKKLKISFIS